MFEDRYTFGTRLDATVADVREGVITALRAEGFGVLTEIDVAETLRAKLGVERDPYLILGACNPPFASRAIGIDPAIGALLPCNIVVRVDGDATVVEAMDPMSVLHLVGDPAVDSIAAEIRGRLVRALEAVATQFPTTEPVA